MKKLMVLTSILFLTGCDTLSLMRQSGKFWCSEKYLSKSDKEPQTPNDIKNTRYEFANNGYIYALAAALALQAKDNSEKEPH